MDPTSSQRDAKVDAGRKANILLYLTDRLGLDAILPSLVSGNDLGLRVIRKRRQAEAGDAEYKSFPEVEVCSEVCFPIWEEECARLAQQSHHHARWADVLFVEMDADTVSAMLAGLAYNTVLSVLRCWNVSKKVIILPELSIDQWTSPIWRRQSMEMQNKWSWIQVLRPALWDVAGDGLTDTDHGTDYTWDWEGPEGVLQTIRAEVQKITHSYRPGSPPVANEGTTKKLSSAKHHDPSRRSPTGSRCKLPPEIWTLISEYLDDWEYATSLGIYTAIPTPLEWLPHIPRSPSLPRSLEHIILTAPCSVIRSTLDNNTSAPSTLSPLAVKLIFKFSLTPILSHLATHQKDIFWTSFGFALIPHEASTIYNSPSILEWWRREPAILKKEYTADALDGASRAGFVAVLDWWATSGLELRYTEKALESASAKGHVAVLEWWQRTSRARSLPLKVGKSILAAAQAGHAATVAWWHGSGIPYAHDDGVARLASAHGHVAVLERWRALRGSKMVFDTQVLVGATKNGHAAVLEWWKSRSGLRVRYKTCDIEEAMEDSLGGPGQREVRDWWERNGLNLGVGTIEWMTVKTLGD